MTGLSGADLITGSAADDILVGHGGNDTIERAGIDTLFGLGGDDVLRPGSLGDTLYGNVGHDTVILPGAKQEFEVAIGKGGVIARGRLAEAAETTLCDVETLVFDSGAEDGPRDTLSLSLFDGIARLDAQQIRLFVEMYIAYFDRAPDAPGLHYWGTRLADRMKMPQIAHSFFVQDETVALYPDPSDAHALVDAVYHNVLERMPDAPGRIYWVDELSSGRVERSAFILSILGGAKGFSGPNASPDLIAQAEADVRTITDKADMGVYYAAIHELDDPFGAARTAMEYYDTTDREGSLAAAKSPIDGFAAEANSAAGGTEFTMPLIGVVPDPFSFPRRVRGEPSGPMPPCRRTAASGVPHARRACA